MTMIDIVIFIAGIFLGGLLDHLIEQKVRNAATAIATGVKTAVADLKQ